MEELKTKKATIIKKSLELSEMKNSFFLECIKFIKTQCPDFETRVEIINEALSIN